MTEDFKNINYEYFVCDDCEHYAKDIELCDDCAGCNHFKKKFWQTGKPEDVTTNGGYIIRFSNSNKAIADWNGTMFKYVEDLHAIVCCCEYMTVKWHRIPEEI